MLTTGLGENDPAAPAGHTCASSASAPWRTGVTNASAFGRTEGAIKRLSDVAMDAPSSWQPSTNTAEQLAPAAAPGAGLRAVHPEYLGEVSPRVDEHQL